MDGQSGYINLMRIKAAYFQKVVEPALMADTAQALKDFPEFREELFDKLHAFSSRYFSRSGSICFAYTPQHMSVYEKVYTDEQDVVLFWKTHMLYYVNRLDYIRHIIDTDSEVRFLNALRDCIKKPNCALHQLDWWMFSKLDQYLDTPFIPYYDPKQNRIARFIPDFIFWGRKGDAYTILFVDPKGTEHIDWERKVDGYRRLFETTEGKLKRFDHEGAQVAVRLFLFTKDRNVCPEGSYKRFWLDQAAALFREAFEL